MLYSPLKKILLGIVAVLPILAFLVIVRIDSLSLSGGRGAFDPTELALIIFGASLFLIPIVYGGQIAKRQDFGNMKKILWVFLLAAFSTFAASVFFVHYILPSGEPLR